MITGRPVPALPSWLTEPLWDQFAALLPQRPAYDPTHPLGCHRTRISDRTIFDKLLQLRLCQSWKLRQCTGSLRGAALR